MDVVATDHIACAGAANVDRVAVAKFFHRVMDLVLFNHVVMRVQKGSHLIQTRLFGKLPDFLSPDRSAKFSASLFEEAGHTSGDNDPGVRRVMHEIVGNAIFAALPDHDPR